MTAVAVAAAETTARRMVWTWESLHFPGNCARPDVPAACVFGPIGAEGVNGIEGGMNGGIEGADDAGDPGDPGVADAPGGADDPDGGGAGLFWASDGIDGGIIGVFLLLGRNPQALPRTF